ncbi:hypothetical protein BECAL_02313 [Bellilinea caldifistulae]|jgi:hypothetical protein|uniref:Uncharacterized protein n=1 Tax=Bellilinea caldifistulae TaxID=360411 RepID=A0A0P6WUB5_9CHLR|nr:hypothetical protein [Bellilinea caldifistulae]KPL73846.1 hypothetical protein AC812_13740 [Bellilinea caldifistulae]GAP11128.1 hypothetical protein BECAL_02313 [Bellilinea caldifistulae]
MTFWRLYMIYTQADLRSALERYELSTGVKPKYARISAKAPAELIEMMRATGLQVEVSKSLLSRDIWLTHEIEQPVL